MTTTSPAGWYRDPHDPSGRQLRWYDGSVWTHHVMDSPTAQASPQAIAPHVSTPQVVAQPQQPQPTAGVQAAPAQVAAAAHYAPSAAPGATAVPGATFEGMSRRDLRTTATRLFAENTELRRTLDEMGFAQRQALAGEIAALGNQLQAAQVQRQQLEAELAAIRQQIVETHDEALLQEVGVYEYAHPLDNSVQYKQFLDQIRDQIKVLVKSETAVTASTEWTVGGSTKDGAKMVKDISKLMLRAYNDEADTCITKLKPHNRDSTVARLDKSKETIAKLGKVLGIAISDHLHALRLQEIRVTADYLAMVAAEKEAQREERERLREEERAAREIARAQEKLQKERSHVATAVAKLREQVASGEASPEAVAELEAKIAEIDEGIHGLAERAANTRAGYVYVISNVGAFGERMVKIGMTRRMEPMDRVRELGDASVPFLYDVHALIFSEDAVGLETKLHQRFADRRVNLVNFRREFFYVTPAEVRDALVAESGHLLEFVEHPEATEYHQSVNERRKRDGAAPELG